MPFDTNPLRRMPPSDFIMHVYSNSNRPRLSASADAPPPLVSVVGRSWITEPTLRCTADEMLDVFKDCYVTSGTRVHFLPRHQSIYLSEEGLPDGGESENLLRDESRGGI